MPLPIEPALYYTPVWLTNGWIVVGYDPSSGPTPSPQVWRVRPDGAGFERIHLREDPDCAATRYSHLTRLPDGRLGLLKTCLAEAPQEDTYELVAYDFEHSRIDTLMKQPIGFRTLGDFSWSPDLGRGIASRSNGICSSLVWLTAEGVEELELDIPYGGEVVRVDASSFSETGCDGHPRVDKPAWSPDGSSIAFFFSPRSEGLSGRARLAAPWDLFLMDPVNLTAQRELEGVFYPSSAAWSPDGAWLAFSGQITGRGKGTWLYSPEEGELRRLTLDTVAWLSWSPDGRAIVGVLEHGGDNQIITYDVTPR